MTAPRLVITHTPAEGTVVRGTERGDGSAEILKAAGWRWGRSLGCWYLPRSRDQRPQRGRIEAIAGALREAGFRVELELDDELRDVAQVEADRATRQAARAGALAARAQRAQEAAEEGWERHARAAAQLPPGGEPIKAGHHSAGRHQRAAERSMATALAALDLDQKAQQAAHRAAAAQTTTRHRYAPQVVAERIERLAARQRAAERRGDHELVAELGAQVDFWAGERDRQIEAGEVIAYGPETVRAGDTVNVSGTWCEVIRTSPKSLTVQTPLRAHRVPWSKVSDHRVALVRSNTYPD